MANLIMVAGTFAAGLYFGYLALFGDSRMVHRGYACFGALLMFALSALIHFRPS